MMSIARRTHQSLVDQGLLDTLGSAIQLHGNLTGKGGKFVTMGLALVRWGRQRRSFGFALILL